MKRNLLYGLTFLLVTAFLTGCCGGGKKETVVVVPEDSGSKETVIVSPEGGGATSGKQLQDLKAAHDQGAITDEEYEKAKEKILKAE
jgi:hypothetical protein